MSLKSGQLPLDAIIDHALRADGADLADMEHDLKQLEKQRAELAAKRDLVPGRKARKLAELDQHAGKLRLASMSTKEFVYSNPVQSKLYQNRTKELAEEQEAAPVSVSESSKSVAAKMRERDFEHEPE